MNAQKTSTFLQKNKKTVLLGIIIFISLVLLYFIIFGNKKIAQIFPSFSPTPTPTPKIYKNLSKELNTILNSQNPKEAAQKANYTVNGEGLKVVITLKDVDIKAANQFFFVSTYGTQQIRYGNTIQATLLFDQIENVAKNPQIKSVVPIQKSTLPPGVDGKNFIQKQDTLLK